MELINLAKNPVPGGARCGMFRSEDGTHIRYAIWQASRGPKLGTICLFNGRTEFIEKYFEVVADLRRRGLAVATMDWRGQGGSERKSGNGRKGHVVDFKEFDQDLIRFMRDIVLPDCPPPYRALAHSMGGNILLRAARKPGSWFDRMVLVAPMLRLAQESYGLSSGATKALAEVMSTTGLGWLRVPTGKEMGWEAEDFEGNVLTSSRERFERNRAIIKAAPELQTGAPTFSWLKAAMRSMNFVSTPNFAAQVRVPLLLIAAGDDRVVSSRAVADLSVQVKVGAQIVVPHARHEILQERDELRRQFWAAFDAYIGCD